MLRNSLVFAVLAVPVLAQANAVPGLDIRMYEVTDLGYTGRRGAAYPNGEAGFMVGHSWCNGGTVNLPWISQSGGVMVDMYPRIAFLLARESGGRMVQISGRSFCKHSPTAFNFSSGPCAPCTSGGGSFFFVGCSDTYGSGINQSQYALGPTEEIDPWLGTWNPQGSYFDRGDPAVTGPAAMDSVRSLTSAQIAAFDAVKNRMTVREPELLAGATYYGQVHAMVQGEPGSARGNNTANREFSITGTGSAWSAGTVGPTMIGSVLTRWSGATWEVGGNGNDDGRFLVAARVTGPTGGMWHYEYAIHNLDNNRGGASFRIPVAPGAIVQNPGFRDLDTDPLDDWTFSQSSTEIAFMAVGTNSLQWNTIYNCWFDCSVEPGAGSMTIDEALPGPGGLSVMVSSHVPSGLAFAYKNAVGSSCGNCTGTFYELFPSSGAFDLTGRSMTATLGGGAYTVVETPVTFLPVAGTNLNFGLNTQTVVNLPFSFPYPGGTTTQLQVHSSGFVSPGAPNLAQAVGSASALLQGNPRWAPAWSLYNPSPGSGNNVYFDANASRAVLTWNNIAMVSGSTGCSFQIQFYPNGTVSVVWGNMASSLFSVLVGWSPGGGHGDPGGRDLSATLSTPLSLCANPFDGMTLDSSELPVLGTTLQWQLGGIPGSTPWGALMRSLQQATPPIDLTAAGMPGCFAHVIDPIATVFVSPGASHQLAESIPNITGLIGLTLVGQAVVYDPPLTPLGLVASNGLVLTLGL
ncbi:MAG TPA: hypothetical protein VFZ65_05235 [Planctomycetota bacterium]|nr:hypothetical protein [Planctomycetota bacterium]